MAYFVVDHATDENKTDGLVESYQMVTVEMDTPTGTQTVMKRLNFVHWPSLPQPFVHEEWNEDLVFSNVYTPENDFGDDEDEDEDEDGEEDEDDEENDDEEENDEVEYEDAEENSAN